MEVTASTFKVVFTIIVFAAVFSAFTSMRTTTLEPQKDNLIDRLESMTGRKLTIHDSSGKGETHTSRQARRLMRESVVYSMLIASDCRLLSMGHMISGTYKFMNDTSKSQTVWKDGSGPVAFRADNMGELAIAAKGSSQSCSGSDCKDIEHKIQRDKEVRAYTGNFRTFYPLLREGQYDLSCQGAENKIADIKSRLKGGMDKLLSLGGAAAGAGIVLAAPTGGLSLVATGALTTAGGVVGYAAGGSIFSTGDGVAAQPSLDMEGKFSSVSFETNQTFKMGMGPEDLLFAANFDIGQESKQDMQPSFWKGRKGAFLVPAGLNFPKEVDEMDAWWGRFNDRESWWNENFEHNVDDAKIGDRYLYGTEGFYAHRVRMKNVPMISEGKIFTEYDNNDIQILNLNKDSEGTKNLSRMMDKTSYLFCKDAEGEIQTNALSMDNPDTKAADSKSNQYAENMVFPYVEITEGAKECFKPVVDASDEIDPTQASIPEIRNSGCSMTKAIRNKDKLLYEGDFTKGTDYTRKLRISCGMVEEKVKFKTEGGRSIGELSYYRPAIVANQCGKRWLDITKSTWGAEKAYKKDKGINVKDFMKDHEVESLFYDIRGHNYLNASSFKFRVDNAKEAPFSVRIARPKWSGSMAVRDRGNTVRVEVESDYQLQIPESGEGWKDTKKVNLELDTGSDVYTVGWEVNPENKGKGEIYIKTGSKDERQSVRMLIGNDFGDTYRLGAIEFRPLWSSKEEPDLFLEKLEVRGEYVPCKE